MKNNIKYLLLKIRSSKWQIKVASDLWDATENAYYLRPGSWLRNKLLAAIIRRYDNYSSELSDYEATLKELTTPISEAELLNKLSININYLDTNYKKITVIFVGRQLRVPKAQLLRMFKLPALAEESMDETNSRPMVRQGGKKIDGRRNNHNSRKTALSQKKG